MVCTMQLCGNLHIIGTWAKKRFCSGGGKGQLYKIYKYTKYTLYTWSLGGAPADKRFGAFYYILALKSDIWWQQF